jgi:hypothetical protein
MKDGRSGLPPYPLPCQPAAYGTARTVGRAINGSVQIGLGIFDNHIGHVCQYDLDVAVFVDAAARAVYVRQTHNDTLNLVLSGA